MNVHNTDVLGLSSHLTYHALYVSAIQVQWDEPSSIMRPDRVSPWEIEPLIAASPPNPQPPQRNKRARPPVLPSAMQDLSSLGTALFWEKILLLKPTPPLRFSPLYVSIFG